MAKIEIKKLREKSPKGHDNCANCGKCSCGSLEEELVKHIEKEDIETTPVAKKSSKDHLAG